MECTARRGGDLTFFKINILHISEDFSHFCKTSIAPDLLILATVGVCVCVCVHVQVSFCA